MEKIKKKYLNHLFIGTAGMNFGQRPGIHPLKMGVKPGRADVRDGFALPNFGPPRGTFCNVDGVKEYLVVCADGPEEFYVQNVSGQADLESLELRMTEFYSEHWRNNGCMPKNQMVIGGFYAVLDEKLKIWHRCRVESFWMAKNPKELEDVIAFQLLDYGKRDMVNLDMMYPLHPDFLELETQVVRASLHDNNDEDKAVKWKSEEKQDFVSSVVGNIIRAYAVECQEEFDSATFAQAQLVIFNEDDGFLMESRLNLADEPVKGLKGEPANIDETEI